MQEAEGKARKSGMPPAFSQGDSKARTEACLKSNTKV